MIEQLPNIGNREYSLYVCRIEPPCCNEGRSTRRKRETDAVMRLVGHCFGSDAVYSHDGDGAPMVNGKAMLSVSHSSHYATLMTGPEGHRMGVDIEESRPAQLHRVARRFLSPREWTIFKSEEELLWAWAAKEAVYKAAGIRALSGAEIALDRPYGNCAFVAGRCYSLSSLRTVDFLIVSAVGQAIAYTGGNQAGD